MKTLAAVAALLLAVTASAASPDPRKARLAALKELVRADKKKLREAALAQHTALELDRARERDGARLVKESAARPETVHLDLMSVHEKSRRERGQARALRAEERARLLAEIRKARAEIRELRRKK